MLIRRCAQEIPHSSSAMRSPRLKHPINGSSLYNPSRAIDPSRCRALIKLINQRPQELGITAVQKQQIATSARDSDIPLRREFNPHDGRKNLRGPRPESQSQMPELGTLPQIGDSKTESGLALAAANDWILGHRNTAMARRIPDHSKP